MTNYPVQHSYGLIAVVSSVVAGLFGWNLLHTAEMPSFLFLATSLGVLGWSVRMALTSIDLTPSQLIVRAPFARTHNVEFGQILSVTEEGRIGKSIVVAYHPRTGDGLLDLDTARAVVLPAVRDQDSLFEQLTERTPA
jgi:hypothetical protein